MKLKYCQEEIPFEQALHGLVEVGMENVLVNELGKALIYQKNFELYQVPKPDKNRMKELIQDFLTQQGIPDHSALDQWLANRQQSRNSLLKQLGFHEQLRMLKRLVLPDAVVQDAFIQRKQQMDWIMFALIQVAQESLIWELYYRIQDDGEDFEQLARQYSMLPSAEFGGLEEPVQLDALNPELKKMLLNLGWGGITEPFTLDGKHFALARPMRTHSTQLTPQLLIKIREDLFAEWTMRQLMQGNLQLEPRAVGMPTDEPAKEMAWL